MRVVMKFGGTSVGDAERIKHVAELVKNYTDRDYEVVVVVSAMSGVTDSLYELANFAAGDGRHWKVEERMEALVVKHKFTIQQALDDPHVAADVTEKLLPMFSEMGNVFSGICYLGELTDRSLAYIVSFGERLCAPIVAGALRCLGINSASYTGGDAGIITNSQYASAELLSTVEKSVSKNIIPLLLKRQVPVVTGFVAEDQKKVITVLGRGGSDYTASIIGAGIDADEIWIWTDVDGVLTTDPRMVKDARTLPIITYLEAQEMSYFGAKVLHTKTIEPAVKMDIPVRVKNTLNPENPGTLIVQEQHEFKRTVKALAFIREVALLNVVRQRSSGTGMVTSRIFSAMAEAGIPLIMISQGSSQFNLSLVIEQRMVKQAVRALNLVAEVDGGAVTVDEDVGVIAIVGQGMAGTPGVAGRIFSSLGEDGINIRMISQSSSEANVSMLVANDDLERALKTLHMEFRLHEVGINDE